MRPTALITLFAISCAGATVPVDEVSTTSAPIAPRPGGMAHVDAATYTTGSRLGEPGERVVRQVRVASFDLDRTEVTVADYAKCVRAGGCGPAPTTVHFAGATPDDQPRYDGGCNAARPDRLDHPQNCVTWSMADAYCRWAHKRLPTEDEWEYAACGTDCAAAVGVRGGIAALRGLGRWPLSAPVATGEPGPFGLYDMAGNVWEWTSSATCPAADDASCPEMIRMARAGSWPISQLPRVRLTARAPLAPATRIATLGFRCARSSAAERP